MIKFFQQKTHIEMPGGQQKPKSLNRACFVVDDHEARPHNSDSMPVFKQKNTNQINGQTKSRILISTQQNWDLHHLKEKLSKFVHFVQFHKVDHTQIWTHKKSLTISEFSHLLHQNYGFYLSNDQLTALLKLSAKNQRLKPKDFQPFGLWLQQPNPLKMTFYKSNFPSQTINIATKPKSNKDNPNKLNKSVDQFPENFEIPQQETIKNSETLKSSFNSTKTYGMQGFKEAQKYSKAKVQKKVEQLKKDIKESVLEKKWDFIVMAGEMNQWIDQLKKQAEKQGIQNQCQNMVSYRFKVLNKDPVEIIQQNTETMIQEWIPHVVFIKKYETLKKKMVKEENTKNNLKGTLLMVLDDQDKFSKNVLINRINQRDQELNFVLLQIMRMKSMFQWQNNVLKEARINS